MSVIRFSLASMQTLPMTLTENFGEVFTRRWVVDTILDLVGYTEDNDLGAQVAVEPSAGSGAFLLAMVERLLASARVHGREPRTLTGAIRAWELQGGNVDVLRSKVQALLTSSGVSSRTAATLANAWLVCGDFLLPEGDLLTSPTGTVTADVIVGNPPYIRIEDLPVATTTAYRQRWRTMGGRADIYVGFLERSLGMLKPGGALGFIVADRWMRNQYGDGLRKLVANRYAVRAVWQMHDVDAFEAEVSAYPAITILANEPQGKAVVADTTAEFGEISSATLVRWSKSNGHTFTGPGVQAHRLDHWFPGDESWPTGSPDVLDLVEHLNDGFPRLHDSATGTKVSIGVATGADKIFITRDPHAVEPDRLLPLSMVGDIASGEFRWQGHYLLNPWTDEGRLVDLDDYPRLVAQLNRPGSTLRGRHVARKNPNAWYRTIDKVDHSLTTRPKLLLQDMKAHIHPVLDPGGYYPHHNLYYVVSEQWDLEVLGGLLLSRIAEQYIAAYCVKMRGGTLRFQAQYLKRLPVPHPSDIHSQLAEELRVAFRNRDVDAATRAASVAYRLEVPRDHRKSA